MGFGHPEAVATGEEVIEARVVRMIGKKNADRYQALPRNKNAAVDFDPIMAGPLGKHARRPVYSRVGGREPVRARRMGRGETSRVARSTSSLFKRGPG